MEKHILLVLCIGTIIISRSCFAWAFDEYDNYDIGDKCETAGTSGICKSVTECPVALNSLRRIQKHNLKRCFWDNADEIVCCPSTDVRGSSAIESVHLGGGDGDSEESSSTIPFTFNNGQSNKRKFQQACENIQGDLKTNIVFHITNGEDATEKGFPHMAALGFENSDQPNGEMDWKCGASIISHKFLLTAAHCVVRAKPIRARLGVTKLNDINHVDIDIRNITIYEGYDPLGKFGDIALIELAQNASFSDRIKPACLYPNETDPSDLLVTGWGKTSIFNEDDRSNILQVARLVAVPVLECNHTFFTRSLGSKTIDLTQICAWGNSSDACWGDSGGPLQVKDKNGIFSIVGIVSYGAGCGGKIPGVYTRVSKYLDWIEKYVWA